MRLLHTVTLQVQDFFHDIPDYVILSHTWGDGEVSLSDMAQPHAQSMPGYAKLRGCCAQAQQDGFEYVWIDTCCIDKQSSAELSEAINSMWKWYWRASICYAYLADVPASRGADRTFLLECFRKSRWFTRGWTLQELLAPAVVEFYGSDWVLLGTKSNLLDVVAAVTRIHASALSSRQNVALASVAQKLSWAAARETKKEEDLAYCLLGLLDVNMPLIYGEGSKAFYRLQLELMKATNEHTLFAWDNSVPGALSYGLLATSPHAFLRCADVHASKIAGAAFVMTNRGLSIRLPCISVPDNPHRILAVLNCYFGSSEALRRGRVGVLLEPYGDGRFRRSEPHLVHSVSHDDISQAEHRDLCVITHTGHIQQEISMRTSYGVSLYITPPVQSRYRLEQFALWQPRFEQGQYAGIDGPIYMGEAAFYELQPDDYAGLLLEGGSENILVALGQRGYSMIWLDMKSGVEIHRFDEAVLQARVEAGGSNSDLLRDSVQCQLADGMVVMVNAKKMRRQGIVNWRLEIDAVLPLGDSGVNEPDELMTVD